MLPTGVLTPSTIAIGDIPYRNSFSATLLHLSRPVSYLSLASTAPKFKILHVAYAGQRTFALEAGASSVQRPHYDSIWLTTGTPRHGSRRVMTATRALKSVAFPRMDTKPKWWWRTLACLPYLLPISDMLVYAEAGFQLKNFLEEVGFLFYPLLDTFMLLPNWFMMVLWYLTYFFVVRRRQWPHFLRFHIVMAMLLSSASQAAGIASTWFPRAIYRGDIPVRFWATFVFTQLFTVLECLRCAVIGKYADVPLAANAAYLHLDAAK